MPVATIYASEGGGGLYNYGTSSYSDMMASPNISVETYDSSNDYFYLYYDHNSWYLYRGYIWFDIATWLAANPGVTIIGATVTISCQYYDDIAYTPPIGLHYQDFGGSMTEDAWIDLATLIPASISPVVFIEEDDVQTITLKNLDGLVQSNGGFVVHCDSEGPWLDYVDLYIDSAKTSNDTLRPRLDISYVSDGSTTSFWPSQGYGGYLYQNSTNLEYYKSDWPDETLDNGDSTLYVEAWTDSGHTFCRGYRSYIWFDMQAWMDTHPDAEITSAKLYLWTDDHDGSFHPIDVYYRDIPGSQGLDEYCWRLNSVAASNIVPAYIDNNDTLFYITLNNPENIIASNGGLALALSNEYEILAANGAKDYYWYFYSGKTSNDTYRPRLEITWKGATKSKLEIESNTGMLEKHNAVWANIPGETPTFIDSNSDSYPRATRSLNSPYAGFNLSRYYMGFSLPYPKPKTVVDATLWLYSSSLTGAYNHTIYYQDWGTTLAEEDWLDKSMLIPASLSIYQPDFEGRSYFYKVPLINLDQLYKSNGRFLLALDDETTEPAGNDYAEYYSWDTDDNGYGTSFLEVTYIPEDLNTTITDFIKGRWDYLNDTPSAGYLTMRCYSFTTNELLYQMVIDKTTGSRTKAS